MIQQVLTHSWSPDTPWRLVLVGHIKLFDMHSLSIKLPAPANIPVAPRLLILMKENDEQCRRTQHTS